MHYCLCISNDWAQGRSAILYHASKLKEKCNLRRNLTAVFPAFPGAQRPALANTFMF
jgi:hypothetical protein